MPAFPKSQDPVRRSRLEESAGLPPLQRERAGRRQADEGPPPLQRGLLAHDAGHRRPIRSGRARCCGPGKARPTRSRTPSTASAWPSSSSRSSARRSTASTTATSPPKARTLAETNKNLDAVVKVLKEEQQRTGIKLLWGTANLFSNPRYMHGAATSCNADAFAFAAAQVKKALEVTKELGGAGYVFWGGREGYQMPLEHRHEARARPPGRLHAHGRRLRQEDRLHRPVLLRAQAQGADQAPVRLRLAPPASTSSAPTAWPTT